LASTLPAASFDSGTPFLVIVIVIVIIIIIIIIIIKLV